MDNKELYEAAEEAIDNLASDTSVSLQTAIDNLMELRTKIDIWIQSLEDDLERIS